MASSRNATRQRAAATSRSPRAAAPQAGAAPTGDVDATAPPTGRVAGDTGTDRSGSWIPRWPGIAGTILAVAGIGDAAYLTYAHYTSTAALVCSDHGTINCAKVTTSVYSHFLGMPVAVLGLAFFLAMLPLQLPVAWRLRDRRLRAARLAATVVGVGMILWLIYAELFRLDAICLWCTGVHGITFLLFVVTVLGTVATSDPLDT